MFGIGIRVSLHWDLEFGFGSWSWKIDLISFAMMVFELDLFEFVHVETVVMLCTGIGSPP